MNVRLRADTIEEIRNRLPSRTYTNAVRHPRLHRHEKNNLVTLKYLYVLTLAQS